MSFIRHPYSEKRANGRCATFVTTPTDKCVSVLRVNRGANKEPRQTVCVRRGCLL